MVGLKYYDFWQFALPHTYIGLLIGLFAFWFLLENQHANLKKAHINEEHGIAPGQACVFYSKNNFGYKVLGGGWITS